MGGLLAARAWSVLCHAGSGRCCALSALSDLEVPVSVRDGALTSLARPRVVATSPTADTLTRRSAAPMSARIPLDYPAIAAFCRRWGLSELALFGSVLRDDFRPDSDVDVLVTFVRGVRPLLDDLLSMQDELAALFARSVDLLERQALERDRNYLLRRHVFEHLEAVYVALISG